MRRTAMVAVAVSALATAACSSQEERNAAAAASLKATLQQAGLTAVAFQSVTGDGTGEVAFSGVTAKAGASGTVAIKRIAFRNADLDPMVRKWTDIGKIEAFGWTLYGGYAPKPKGFKAESMVMTGVTAIADGSLLFKAEAETVKIKDFDSTRPGALRYSGYSVGGMSVSVSGMQAARIAKADVEADRWTDGLVSPLRSSTQVEGAVSFAPLGLAAPLGGSLPSEVSFTAKGATDISLDSGAVSLEGELDTQGFGKVVASARFGGVDRNLLELLSQASKAPGGDPPKPAPSAAADGKAKAAAGKKDKAAGKPDEAKAEPAPVPTAAQKIMEATSKVTFEEMRVEGAGLEWLGKAMDVAFGGREAAASAILPVLDAGFRGQEKSDSANVALGGVYLFLMNPSAFSLRMSPAQPVALGPEAFARYARAGSGLLDDLGFSFTNDASDGD